MPIAATIPHQGIKFAASIPQPNEIRIRPIIFLGIVASIGIYYYNIRLKIIYLQLLGRKLGFDEKFYSTKPPTFCHVEGFFKEKYPSNQNFSNHLQNINPIFKFSNYNLY